MREGLDAGLSATVQVVGRHTPFPRRWALGPLLIALLATVGSAQARPTKVIIDLNSQNYAQSTCETYAAEAGAPDLAQAIQNGEVEIFVRFTPGEGGWNSLPFPAMSVPAQNGQPAVRVVRDWQDGDRMGAEAIHEWIHLRDGDPYVPT